MALFTRFNIETGGRGEGRQTVVAVLNWGMGLVQLMCNGCACPWAPNCVLRFQMSTSGKRNPASKRCGSKCLHTYFSRMKIYHLYFSRKC